MKLPFPKIKYFFANLSLEAGLHIAWFVILSLFIALLFLDGFIFYQYGLGRIETASNIPVKSAFSNVVETLKLAASKIEARQSQFQSSVSNLGIANPFEPR